MQLRLIVFDGEDVVAAAFQHFFADILLAEHGVAGDHLALQGQDAQQLQGGLVLVGLAIDAELTDDRRHLGGVGGEQVDARGAVAGGTTERLAIQGDGVAEFRAACQNPAGQGLFVGVDVELAEEDGQRTLAGGVETGEAEGEPEGQAVIACELGDGFQTAHAREGGDGGEAEDRAQGMASSAAVAGIGDVSEDLEQRRAGGNGHVTPPPNQGT